MTAVSTKRLQLGISVTIAVITRQNTRARQLPLVHAPNQPRSPQVRVLPALCAHALGAPGLWRLMVPEVSTITADGHVQPAHASRSWGTSTNHQRLVPHGSRTGSHSPLSRSRRRRWCLAQGYVRASDARVRCLWTRGARWTTVDARAQAGHVCSSWDINDPHLPRGDKQSLAYLGLEAPPLRPKLLQGPVYVWGAPGLALKTLLVACMTTVVGLAALECAGIHLEQ